MFRDVEPGVGQFAVEHHGHERRDLVHGFVVQAHQGYPQQRTFFQIEHGARFVLANLLRAGFTLVGWQVADVFPGGGGNWGGSYLTVPANGPNVDAAIELATWLTAPEQQIKAFANAGTFPSQLDAYENPELTDFVNPAGLQARGENLFLETTASGPAQNGNPGLNGLGSVVQGALEGSNVNVVEELVSMIETQRAYEMNAKAISTTDSMLGYLNNNV